MAQQMTVEQSHEQLEQALADAQADGFDPDDYDVYLSILQNLAMDWPAEVRGYWQELGGEERYE